MSHPLVALETFIVRSNSQTMNIHLDQRRPTESQIAGRVRGNVASAAIAALLLLYFGFRQFGVMEGDDLFSLAGNVFLWTLRIGGVAFAIIALWSLLGQAVVLAVDGVVSVAVGALLILTGLAMLLDGGYVVQAVPSAICGYLFLSAGLRNCREYRSLAGGVDGSPGFGRDGYDPRFDDRYEASRTSPPPPSLGSRLLKKVDETDDLDRTPIPVDPLDAIPSESPDEPAFESRAPKEDAPTEPVEDPQDDDDQPPDGFLASFADEDPPPRP